MAKLFGVDIKGLAHKHIMPGLLPGRYTSRTEGDLKADVTEGREVVETTYDFRGIVSSFEEDEFVGSVRVGDKKLLYMSKSTTVPKSGDSATIDGETYRVEGVLSRDPVKATYVLHGRGLG